MRTAIFRLLVAVSLVTGVAKGAEDPRVTAIRREHDRILAALPSVTLEAQEVDGYSAEGGVAKAWRDGAGRFVYLRVELFGESGKVLGEFFYGGGKPIFALRQTHRYNVPAYVTPERAKEMGTEPFDARKTVLLEDRYWFQDGRLFRWVNERKEEVDPRSPEFAEDEEAVLELGAEISRKFPAPAGGRGAVPVEPAR